MVKHIQAIHWLLPTNCLSVFDHYEGLALKRLNSFDIKLVHSVRIYIYILKRHYKLHML